MKQPIDMVKKVKRNQKVCKHPKNLVVYQSITGLDGVTKSCGLCGKALTPESGQGEKGKDE